MKKSYLFGLVGLVVIAAVVVGIVSVGGKSGGTTSSTQTASAAGFKANIKNACDILTQSVADGLLGAGAKSGDNSAGNTEANGVKVTDCNYTSGSGTSVGLLVRAAETQAQADSNTAQFNGKTNVPGYGDKAYWDATYGQLNILAHGNWYILTSGPINPAQHTQADGQKFAEAIKSQL